MSSSLCNTFTFVRAVSKSAIASCTGMSFVSWSGGLSCPGGRPRGLGISSLFKPGYFKREVMDGALQDRDDLGVDLCLGRRLGPLLRNARALSVLSQNNQSTNETMARLASCE